MFQHQRGKSKGIENKEMAKNQDNKILVRKKVNKFHVHYVALYTITSASCLGIFLMLLGIFFLVSPHFIIFTYT